jgi:hypothetical protein
MRCEDRADALLLRAAGLLEGDEAEELRAHLASGCMRCAAELAEARALVESLARSGEPVEPTIQLRERLLARARAEAATRPAPVRSAAGPSPARAALAAAAAAAIVAIGGALATYALVVAPARRDAAQASAALEQERTKIGEERTALAAAQRELEQKVERLEAELGELGSALRVKSAQVELLRKDDLVVVALAPPEAGGEAHARVFWDREDYLCYLHAVDLDPPADGHRLVLWVYTAKGETVAAGALELDDNGEATMFAELPRGTQDIVRAVVTEESGETGAEPTGLPLLSWSAPRRAS